MVQSPKSAPSAKTKTKPATEDAAKSKAKAKPAAQRNAKPVKTTAKAEARSTTDKPAGEGLRLNALLDAVAATTGQKRSDIKAVVEATLAELGASLSRGEAFALPPLGRGKVNRKSESDGEEVMMVKLKRGGKKVAASEDEA